MTVNANGTPGLVASGELVESAWGNATSKSITRLFGYSVPRIVFKGNASTDANGEFAVGTGFTPTAAFCIGTQFDFPTLWWVNLFTSTQVSFRGKNFPANTPAGPSLIGVSYVIFGPPANP